MRNQWRKSRLDTSSALAISHYDGHNTFSLPLGPLSPFEVYAATSISAGETDATGKSHHTSPANDERDRLSEQGCMRTLLVDSCQPVMYLGYIARDLNGLPSTRRRPSANTLIIQVCRPNRIARRRSDAHGLCFRAVCNPITAAQ